jgi:hypothetical protein
VAASTSSRNASAPTPSSKASCLRYDQTPVGFIGRGRLPHPGQPLRGDPHRARPLPQGSGRRSPSGPNESFTFRDEYDVGSDPTAFFDQSGQAIERLSTSFGRSLVAAMLEAF